MHFKMSSAICLNFDQSKILLSGYGLNKKTDKLFFLFLQVNSLADDKILDLPKLRGFADDNLKVVA